MPLSRAGLVTAIVVLLAFGAFVIYLASKAGESDTTWAHLAWLFSSVEALAFGAAGALFGSNIQRDRAERAEEAARVNGAVAERGRVLAAVLKADDPAAASSDADVETLGPRTASDRAANSVAAKHAAVARELFP